MFAQAVFVCSHWQMDDVCVCGCVGVGGWVGGGPVGTAGGLLCECPTQTI